MPTAEGRHTDLSIGHLSDMPSVSRVLGCLCCTMMTKPNFIVAWIRRWKCTDFYRATLPSAVCAVALCALCHSLASRHSCLKVKVKAFPYSIPSVGPGADSGVQAVSPQVTVSHPPGSRLPLLFVRSAVTSPASEHHRPLAGTKLYCLVPKAHRCEQLAQGCYVALPLAGFEPATYWLQVQRSTHGLLRTVVWVQPKTASIDIHSPVPIAKSMVTQQTNCLSIAWSA